MANEVLFWRNVGVDVQTVLAPAVTVNSISKASPGVLGYDGVIHPAEGAYIVLFAPGMSQMTERVFRIKNVNDSAKTFELEGEDTTGYDDFVSGTYQVITFGASFDTVQNVAPSGGDYNKEDTSTIHRQTRRNSITDVNPLVYEMTNYFDPADPGFAACRKAFMNQEKRAIRFRFGVTHRTMFYASVGAHGAPGGSSGAAVTTPVTFEAQGMPTTVAGA